MTPLNVYLAKKRDEVLRKWKKNEISLVDAARELVDLGMTPEQAWALLERT